MLAGSLARELVVLNLEVPRDELLRRLSGRGREDDKDQAVARRLQEYDDRTTPPRRVLHEPWPASPRGRLPARWTRSSRELRGIVEGRA